MAERLHPKADHRGVTVTLLHLRLLHVEREAVDLAHATSIAWRHGPLWPNSIDLVHGTGDFVAALLLAGFISSSSSEPDRDGAQLLIRSQEGKHNARGRAEGQAEA